LVAVTKHFVCSQIGERKNLHPISMNKQLLSFFLLVWLKLVVNQVDMVLVCLFLV